MNAMWFPTGLWQCVLSELVDDRQPLEPSTVPVRVPQIVAVESAYRKLNLVGFDQLNTCPRRRLYVHWTLRR